MKGWNRVNIPQNLANKIYIITGTSSGIGTVMAYELAKRGAMVIGGNRKLDKAQHALNVLKNGQEKLDSFINIHLDISSLASVKSFAERINADPNIPHIDGLILNAGIMALPKRNLSADGFEMQMATNVLGHHLLTSLLLNKLKSAPGIAVVVATSSSASTIVKDQKKWDDLNSGKRYDPWEVYGLSKIAAYQFRDGFREGIKNAGFSQKIKVIATHPGLTSTPLFDGSAGFFGTLFRSVKGLFMMKPEQGALSSLRAILDDSIPDGSFVGPGGLTGFSGDPKIIKTYNPTLALNETLRKKMWDFCNEKTGAEWLF